MWKSMLYFLLIAVTLNANMAPTSSKSGNIVDFSQNPSSPSSLAKVYVDVEKIKREVNFITAYLPRDKKITSCFGNSSDICKINATQCDSIYEDPSCPDNGTLNTVRNMCQKPSVDSCPVGYIYDNSIDRCVISVVCPDGGTFNGATDRCEKVVLDKCPTDYSLDATNSVCWKAVTCNNPSAVFNPDRDRCEMPMNIGCDDGYAYNPSTYQCERTPTCSKGIYNNTYNKCLADYVEKCDTANGYTYNTTSKQCEKTPSCQAGTSYNTVTNRCEGGTACSTGTWNSTTQKCESGSVNSYAAQEENTTVFKIEITMYSNDKLTRTVSTCLNDYSATQFVCNNKALASNTSDFLLSAQDVYTTIHRVLALPENTRLFVSVYFGWWWTYKDGYKVIETIKQFGHGYGVRFWLNTSFSCPNGGTLSGTNCIVNTLVQTSGTCPAGLTANPTTGICTANPTCPISNGFGAATFDGNIDKCYTATQKDCSLNPGYVYDIASNKCSGDANCTGGLLDVNTDKCFKSACPTNYSFNTATKACEANPICSNNSIYNTTYDKCLIDFTPSCDTTSGYTYNTASKQCERTPSCQAGTSYNATTNRCEGGSACSTGTWNSTTQKCESSVVGVAGEYTVTSYGWVNQGFYAYPFDPIINATSFSTDYTRLAEIYPVGIGFNNQNHTINFGLLNGPLPISTIMSMPEKQYVQYDYSSQNYPIDSCYIISAHWRTLNGIKRIELTFADTCWNGSFGVIYNLAASSTCPPGSTQSGANCIASTSGTCPAGLTANPTTGICTANPTCPISNGFGAATFDGNIDKCWTTYITTCGNGFMYDSALKMCVKDVDCNNSKAILNTTTEKCQITIGDCGALNFDTTKNICFSDPMCDLGAYNDSHIRCEASVSKDCATYTYDSSSSKCFKQITCPTDEQFIHKNSIAYSNELNKCVSFAEHTCSNNYTYNGLPIAMCEAIPICSGGVYNPENDRCFTGQRVCPIGNFSCLPSGQEYWCSPYKCDAQAQCGTATCANGTVGSKSIQDSSKCYAHICDTSMPYNEYCGEDACPTGFGVYKESGKCYQDVCPTGSSQNGTGACQTLKCPFGTSEVNGQCFENN